MWIWYFVTHRSLCIFRLLHMIYFRVNEYCTTSEVLAYQNYQITVIFFLYGLMVQLNNYNDNIFAIPSAFTLLPTQLNAPVSWNQQNSNRENEERSERLYFFYLTLF